MMTPENDYLKWVEGKPDEFFAQDDGDLMEAGFKAGRNAGLEAAAGLLADAIRDGDYVDAQELSDDILALKTAETGQG